MNVHGVNLSMDVDVDERNCIDCQELKDKEK